MTLSDNHKRAVFSTLKVVENRIDDIELLILNNRTIHSHIVAIDISKEEVVATLKTIKETKEAIANVFIKYEIKPEVIVLSRVINTFKTFIWKDLGETDTKSLMHYGSFTNDENPLELDKDLKHILALTEKLLNK
jgi:hypothetical protein